MYVSFGGSYALGKFGLVKNAENYKVLKMKDATEEYLFFSQKYWKIMNENKYEIFKIYSNSNGYLNFYGYSSNCLYCI